MNLATIASRNSLQGALIFLFSIALLVDAINGLTVRTIGVSISEPFKFILLALAVIYSRQWSHLLVAILIVQIYVVVHALLLEDLSLAISSSGMLLKFFAVVLFYGFFRTLVARKGQKSVIHIVTVAAIIIAANLLSGLFGFGYAQYTGDGQSAIGSRGWFYSGNEVSVAYVTVISILLMTLIVQKRYFAYTVTGTIAVVLSVLLATKLSILSVLILLIGFPFLALADNHLLSLRLAKGKVVFASVISMLFPAITIVSVYVLLYKINLIERLTFFYNSMDFLTFILSGRNRLAADAWEIYSTDYSMAGAMFGYGQYWDGPGAFAKLVEIDPVDILMSYGALGVVLIYGFFLFAVIQCAFRLKVNPYSKFVIASVSLLMAISFSAGHVVYSGLGGYLIAALLALGTVRFRNSVDEDTAGRPEIS